MKFCERDGVRFHFVDEGHGVPFFFQHGLGGDLNQPVGLCRPRTGLRLVAFDVRGHGESRPLGDIEKLTIGTLADDLIALMDYLDIERAIVGGISLGAAIAVNVALRHADRVLGTVLVRPAWIDRPLPENVARYATIARLIREVGPRDGLARFRSSGEFLALQQESPDCALSLVGQFENPRAVECVARLERLVVDSPCSDSALYGNLKVPALVVGNHQDPIHPFSLARTLCELIAGAEFREVTSKSVSVEQYTCGVRQAIDDFLNDHFLITR